MCPQVDNSPTKLPRTKIVATLGPASWEEERLRTLIAAGVSVVRINFSHAEPVRTAATMDLVRKIATDLDRNVAILADLQGPRIRVGELPPEGVMLREGERVLLTTEDDHEPQGDDGTLVIPVDYDLLWEDVEPGDTLLLADGMMAIQVAALRGRVIEGLVLVGGPLSSHKGINVPGRTLRVPTFTDKDREDLEFALDHGADMVALSFVRSGADVDSVREQIKKRVDRYVPIISKIEKHEAVANFTEILDASDGIMVARGDLGVELPPEKLPTIQKRLIAESNVAGKPVITATQMLDSMIRNFRPTRAEATDVANAVLDGSDAVMLSGETASGKYPIESVRMMVRICFEAEKVFDYEGWAHRIEQITLGGLRWSGEEEAASEVNGRVRVRRPAVTYATGATVSPITEEICLSADRMAEELGAAAIITLSRSGLSPRLLAKYRPRPELIAITDDPAIQRSLAVCWGVRALLTGPFEQTAAILEEAAQRACELELVKNGDLIVLTGGLPITEPYRLNMLQVQVIH